MKFTITSITEEGVRGLSDNIAPVPDVTLNLEVYQRMTFNWREAEANRKEYLIKQKKPFKMSEDRYFLLKEGSRIEGDIKDNQIINIKIL